MITAICGPLIPARNKMMFYRDVSGKKKKKPNPSPDINLFHPFSFHRMASRAVKSCTFLNEMKAEFCRNKLY